jgi:hypothetical protein
LIQGWNQSHPTPLALSEVLTEAFTHKEALTEAFTHKEALTEAFTRKEQAKTEKYSGRR